MLERAVTLFRLQGIPIRVDASWLIIAVLVTWSLTAGFFPSHAPGLEGSYLAMGIAGALGLFLSIIVHEFCHASVGRRAGVEIRSITLFVFGGVAEMRNEPPSPKAEFWMAIAGPIGSVVLAGLFTGLFFASGPLAWPAAAAGVLFWLAWINTLLAGFNMVPAFPLDGGRVLRSILWHGKKSLKWATRITSRIGSWFGAAMIALGILAIFGGNFIGGIWWALLGMFLRSAAKSSYRQVLIRRFLEGERVRDFMTSEVVSVPPTITVSKLIEDYVYVHHFRLYPVVDDTGPLGYVTVDDLGKVSAEQRDELRVRDLLRPCSDDVCIGPDASMPGTLRQMQRTGHHRMLVVEEGALLGLVTLKDVTDRLALTLELEEENRSTRVDPTGRREEERAREPALG